MIKKLVKFILIIFILFAFIKPIFAQEKKATIYFFWSKSCPHCAREKVFLNELVKKYPETEIKSFEVSANQENLDLLKKVSQEFQVQSPGLVPFTAVGKYHFVGYLDDETTGKEIEEALRCHLAEGCQDIVGPLIDSETIQKTPQAIKGIPETLHLPLLGEIKTKALSLPALTVIIGLLDGFNPCAMWTLLFLISLLLSMKDRRRMWTLGVAFIVASGFVYFLFLAAWLNLFLFLGFIIWVRILIGLVALGAGGYSLRSYLVNKEGGCEVGDEKKRERVFTKIRKITQDRRFLFALLGIILLAFAVNLVELICSAGLPAVYTKILSLSPLPGWQYYLYLFLYILFFMLDDLFVFFVAMTTLQAVGIQTKYARLSRLIGGILMVIIGLLLLFKPEYLMFG